MSELHLRPLWLSIGWGMVIAVVVLSLLPVPDMGVPLPSDKLLHLLAYGGLMGWFLQLFSGRERFYYGAGFIVLGIVLEFLQGLTSYRLFEWWDVVANCSGVVLAWLLGLTPFESVLSGVERILNRQRASSL